MLCASLAGQQIRELFEEYEAGSTPEALLVKDFDKVGADAAMPRIALCVLHAPMTETASGLITAVAPPCSWR